MWMIVVIIGVIISAVYELPTLFLALCIVYLSIIFMSANEGYANTNFIADLRHSGYPDNCCVTPKKMKFLFVYRKDVEGGNEIPKEIAQINILI